MFSKILIANRGEIACRIARTARRMGIATVAVYSEADANALHVGACDEAVCIGPAPATESYLRADKILDAAIKTGAQAIHPGYGFLSENAAFAKQCVEQRIAFIGPSAASILGMGSKSAARQTVSAAGVPVLPGYDGDNQDLAFLQSQADEIGYPLLIKAVSGGGGKGMRTVSSTEEFATSLEAVKRESQGAFGDDRVMLERYLPVARHVEIQIFADSHGNCVHLFERDCSMQRRHQKVLEEAPAPMMSDALRQNMAQAAIDCAKAIDYTGAGTIEFLLGPDDQFYFMEMNTRLQVEHPVTEMISGQDLVEWQIRVAGGEALPRQQHELMINGHAVEARIYAENPEQGFLPATGTLHYLCPPESSPDTRIDTGVSQGDEISVYYDPMIAKLIVWGEDRRTAFQRMSHALNQYHLLGVRHNIFFLRNLVDDPEIVAGRVHTRFIEQQLDNMVDQQTGILDSVIVTACCHQLLQHEANAVEYQQSQSDPWSPWAACDGWQHHLKSRFLLCFEVEGEEVQAAVEMDQHGYQIFIEDRSHQVRAQKQGEHRLLVELNGQRVEAAIAETGNEILIAGAGANWSFKKVDLREQEKGGADNSGALTAPMPGTVVAVLVNENDEVKAGQALMIIEAMKMEHQINAAEDGVVKAIHFAQGSQVNESDTLLVIE